MIKPDPQLRFRDDVPEGVIAVGDIDSRLKDWFANVPESVVLLRPDRFIAAMSTPQQVSDTVVRLGAQLRLKSVADELRHRESKASPPACIRRDRMAQA